MINAGKLVWNRHYEDRERPNKVTSHGQWSADEEFYYQLKRDDDPFGPGWVLRAEKRARWNRETQQWDKPETVWGPIYGTFAQLKREANRHHHAYVLDGDTPIAEEWRDYFRRWPLE